MWPLDKRTRTTKLTRAVLLVAAFFAVDKLVAFLRQLIIGRQFGLSTDLDAFNVANNVPDMLFALISGGALAMAFIPVLAEVLTRDGRPAAWDLFSRVANIAFLVTAVMAVVIALAAGPLVRAEFGIAPGFSSAQQDLVVPLMRLNLVATLIFSISGLMIAGLQSNQHFLLPALAPILYNLGQIFGALVLVPRFGVRGLVYGVILGALLHMGIQIPGLIHYKFRWTPSLKITEPVKRVLLLMIPRLFTMLTIQLIFIIRDNLASRLAVGSVSALTYGWMIFQMPETLIGTAIGVAMLPSLAEMFAQRDDVKFKETVERAVRVLLAVTLPVAAVAALGLRPLIALAFGFDAAGTDLLLWVSRAYLLGLAGQCLMEVAGRSFYARQNALMPLLGGLINVTVYMLAALLLFKPLGAPGVALAEGISFTIQALVLLTILSRKMPTRITPGSSLLRGLAAALIGGVVVWLIMLLLDGFSALLAAAAGMLAGAACALPFIWRDLRLLLRM